MLLSVVPEDISAVHDEFGDDSKGQGNEKDDAEHPWRDHDFTHRADDDEVLGNPKEDPDDQEFQKPLEVF